MSKLTRAAKRIVVGRAFRSDKLAHTLLPKRIALPVFASDALSSVAYAPGEIFVSLSVAGLAAYAYAPWVGLAVALVMTVVILSYRLNVHAYPSGGGDYEVATKNLGQRFGLLVGSALLVDYILTVAVSTASGVENIGSAIPIVAEHKVWFSVGIIALVTAANLRGLKEAGAAFAVPVYAFFISVLAMIVTGFIRFAVGSEMRAESADFTVAATHGATGFALVFLLLRAFSTGSAALTGVEAISNGVPAFKKPKSKNAATTLALMGIMAVTMMLGIVLLARITGVVVTEPGGELIGAPDGYVGKTVIAQIAQTVFSGFPLAFYIVSFTTGLILVLACNTAFSGFPVLGSILAQDRFLPRQLHTRGDRLAFSNGIVFLAVVAIVLIIGFQANVTALIQLYVVGVFVSFTTSQGGMIRHWNRRIARERDPAALRVLHRNRVISATGFVMTGTVLVIVLVTKFLAGAWITIVAMAVIYATMVAIRRHYDRVASEIAADEEDLLLPSRVHAVVLVSKVHLPTMRALAFARATRPDILEAVTVNVDPHDTSALAREWEDREIPVSLKVIDSPFREITKPVLDYVKRIRKDSPRDVVSVYLPEYVVGHWWEQLLHNQSALRLKGRLLFTPGVMVTSVPWQLSSSESAEQRIAERADREISTLGRRSAASRIESTEPTTTPGGPASNGSTNGASGNGSSPGRRHATPIPSLVLLRRAAVTQPADVDSAALAVGDTVELTVGPVAHGGHCVARHAGRVVFVRHALPGERVIARITEARQASFTRADAVEVLEASPDRVVAPCAHFRPGGCGGCDFQHADAAAQRRYKESVVGEQLRRLGGVDRPVEVEELPGTGFGWRTRVRWGVADDGAVGPRRYRSSEVVPLSAAQPCLIAAAGLTEAALAAGAPPGEAAFTAVEDGPVLVSLPGRPAAAVREDVFGRTLDVAADGFWQVHPDAAEALVDAVLDFAPGIAGAAVWDLYSGVGLFADFLADHAATVDCVESDPAAVAYARANLADRPGVTVHLGRVERLLDSLPDPGVVVLDPPRSGAGKAICAAVAGRRPAGIVYVACDPAALGRDTRYLQDLGYRLSGLRAFDAFPQTHHVECVAHFVPAATDQPVDARRAR